MSIDACSSGWQALSDNTAQRRNRTQTCAANVRRSSRAHSWPWCVRLRRTKWPKFSKRRCSSNRHNSRSNKARTHCADARSTRHAIVLRSVDELPRTHYFRKCSKSLDRIPLEFASSSSRSQLQRPALTLLAVDVTCNVSAIVEEMCVRMSALRCICVAPQHGRRTEEREREQRCKQASSGDRRTKGRRNRRRTRGEKEERG